jgi:hypothetical protein
MVYGKEKVFDADRLIDLLNAFESFTVAAGSARGEMDSVPAAAAPSPAAPGGSLGGGGGGGFQRWPGGLAPPLAALLGPSDGAAAPLGGLAPWLLGGGGGSNGGGGGAGAEAPQLFGNGIGLLGLPANRFDVRQGSGALDSQGRLREALRFVFSQVGRG